MDDDMKTLSHKATSLLTSTMEQLVLQNKVAGCAFVDRDLCLVITFLCWFHFVFSMTSVYQDNVKQYNCFGLHSRGLYPMAHSSMFIHQLV